MHGAHGEGSSIDRGGMGAKDGMGQRWAGVGTGGGAGLAGGRSGEGKETATAGKRDCDSGRKGPGRMGNGAEMDGAGLS